MFSTHLYVKTQNKITALAWAQIKIVSIGLVKKLDKS